MIDQAQKLREKAREKFSGAESDAGKAAPGRKFKKRIGGGRCVSIAVTGGKGGVGKSNISLYLSQALSRLNKKVLLFDADLGLANIHILLGIAPRQNFSHVVDGNCPIRDIIHEGPDGISVIPGSNGIEAMANLEAARLEDIIRSFASIEAEYDYLVVDVGAGIGDLSISLSSSVDKPLLILTTDPASLTDVYATCKLLWAGGVKKISVLVNMAESQSAGVETFKRLQAVSDNFLGISLDLAGVIPMDSDIRQCVRSQKSIMSEKPGSVVAKRMVSVARHICGIPADVKKEGLFSRIFSLKGKER